MKLNGETVHQIVVAVVLVILIGGFIIWTVKNAEDPARIAFKWFLTAVVIGLVVWIAFPLFDRGDSITGLALTLFGALILVATWRHNLADIVAKPFAALYDGGDQPPDPHPAYSVSQSRQKQGKYVEAIAEIRKQLNRFPTDVEGQLLLAQIQAEDLEDLPAAEITIQSFCAQPSHARQNVAFALYSMADWHLSVGKDREAARRDLEKLIELFPDSEFALGASQRIAHLGSLDMLLSPQERKQFIVTAGAQNLGLRRGLDPKPQEIDPTRAAADYVKHLAEHPLDTEAREKLAVIYADHYGRLDLAADQLEQMINQPNQPAKLVVHWLNLLADLQIRCGADYETVKQTVQRIIDRDPGLAAADIARNRLGRLKLEFKGKQKSQGVALGSYEQNIGLKQRSTPGG